MLQSSLSVKDFWATRCSKTSNLITTTKGTTYAHHLRSRQKKHHVSSQQKRCSTFLAQMLQQGFCHSFPSILLHLTPWNRQAQTCPLDVGFGGSLLPFRTGWNPSSLSGYLWRDNPLPDAAGYNPGVRSWFWATRGFRNPPEKTREPYIFSSWWLQLAWKVVMNPT